MKLLDTKTLCLFTRRYEEQQERLAGAGAPGAMAARYGIAADFGESRKDLAEHEGGNDDDPQDPGGRTSRGIIQSEYDAYRDRHKWARRDVWMADNAEVDDIYKVEYWDRLRCDELPAGLDYCVFDYGVNSGVGRAAKVLQNVLGVTVDGVVGPATVLAANSMAVKPRINSMCDERLAFLRGLKTWPHFGNGWSRRVSDVRSAALIMASQPAVISPPAARPSQNPLVAVFNAILAMFRKP